LQYKIKALFFSLQNSYRIFLTPIQIVVLLLIVIVLLFVNFISLKMKKFLSVFSMSVLMIFLSVFVLNVKAASNATVTATVTVQSISVTVSDGNVAYGTLALNTSAGTNGTDTQTATNNGNVAEDLLIRGQNSAGWTLGATAASDQYVHRFCIATCGSAPTNYTALTTNNQTLADALATSGTQTFDLHITTPTSSSTFAQQSVDIIVTATAN
jgi:energy-coupling factor transporter transmembrane protein EcfT